MKNTVVIGGGTGSYTVLRGLKQYDLGITSVVSMFDSGGSAGRLRDEFGFLPAGDARRALIALSDNGALRELFEYRFKNENSPLNDHNFGNVLLTALTDIYKNEAIAIEKAGHLLNIKGRVLPVSLTNTHLCAKLENGETIVGETNIDIRKHHHGARIVELSLQDKATLYDHTQRAIREADLIVIGPGDLYSSIIPNLLVQGMPEALRTSKARIAYVCNLMTKRGETDNFTASEHAKEIVRYAPGVSLDYVICNSRRGKKELLDKYAAEHSFPVVVDDAVNGLARKTIREDLITEPDLIRHDSAKLASILADLASKLVIFDLDDTLFDTTGQLQGEYRNVLSITPYPDAQTVLAAPGYRKVLVTTGDPKVQYTKLDVLGIRQHFDDILVCATREQKKNCFADVLAKYRHHAGDVIVVGDRIDSEIKYGKELGCVTVRVTRGKHQNLQPKDSTEIPDHDIDRLDKLLTII